MQLTLFALVVLAGGFAVNLVATPLILRLAHKKAWYDAKDHRKIHTENTPRLGGVGIVTSVLLATVVALALAPGFGLETATLARLWPVPFGLLMIHLLGLIDDFVNLPALLKFFIQLSSAAVVTVGFRIQTIPIPLTNTVIDLGIFAFPITMLWIVAVANAVNLIDGMDGLAGGVAAFAAFFTALSALLAGDAAAAFFSLALLGALVAFLTFNFPPAKIFMGDSGSLSLGFVLAVIPLIRSGSSGSLWSLVPMITLLLVPILDTTMAILRRIKNGRSILSPDREHIHHKLLDVGLGNRKILLVVYSTCVVLGFATLAWQLTPSPVDATVILVVWVLSLVAFFTLDRLAKRRAANGSATP